MFPSLPRLLPIPIWIGRRRPSPALIAVDRLTSPPSLSTIPLMDPPSSIIVAQALQDAAPEDHLVGASSPPSPIDPNAHDAAATVAFLFLAGSPPRRRRVPIFHPEHCCLDPTAPW